MRKIERDCDNCIRNVPGFGCSSWDCDPITRSGAIEAVEAQRRRSEIQSEYIKREDAIGAFADYLTETAMEDLGIKHGKEILFELHCDDVSNILADIPSADVVERERYDRLKRNFKYLSEDYDELTKKVERADMRGVE